VFKLKISAGSRLGSLAKEGQDGGRFGKLLNGQKHTSALSLNRLLLFPSSPAATESEQEREKNEQLFHSLIEPLLLFVPLDCTQNTHPLARTYFVRRITTRH